MKEAVLIGDGANLAVACRRRACRVLLVSAEEDGCSAANRIPKPRVASSSDVSPKSRSSCSYWERNHIANVLTKLDVHSQLQAVVFALRYDVVKIR